jgi:AraC-like DNA-binding protein
MGKGTHTPTIRSWNAEGLHLHRIDLAPAKNLEIHKAFFDEIVILAFSGSVWRSEQNGRSYVETPDCVIMRPAGQVFSAKCAQIDENAGAICREFHIPAGTLNQLYDVSDRVLPALEFASPLIENPDLAQILRRTHSLFEDGACSLQATTGLAWMIAGLARQSSGKALNIRDTACSRRCAQMVEYLRAHFDSKITLNDLALRFDINPYVLLRQFRKFTGLTPHDYVQAYRVYQARRLIETGVPLAEVAAICGFVDQSHLNRLFRQKLGVTPGQFAPKNGKALH